WGLRAFALMLLAWSKTAVVSFHDNTVTADFVQQAHARGLLVLPYTVNEPSNIAQIRAFGVDGVFTNYPERVLETN
ncbi:MAG: glycerophosphodiester phosphodiesterase family protein, partial [Chloroflexota bacterium]